MAKKGNLDYSVDRQAFIDQGWVIPSKDLKLGETIGKGEFGGIIATYHILSLKLEASEESDPWRVCIAVSVLH